MSRKTAKYIINLALRFKDDEILALASQLSYSLIFAFFPFLIFIITIIGYSSIDSADVLAGLNKILPVDALQLVKDTVIEVVDGRNGRLLVISLIFSMWSAAGGFNAVIKGINKAYRELEHRSVIKVQLTSIICALGVAFIIIITILFLVFGQIIGDLLAVRLGLSYFFKVTWNITRYIVIISSTIFIFAAIYHYTPCRRLTWREVMPGAIFSTIGLIAVSMGFAFYVNNFGNYSLLYGSIGAVIMLLTWLFLTSIIVIMGGELNAELIIDKLGKSKIQRKKN